MHIVIMCVLPVVLYVCACVTLCVCEVWLELFVDDVIANGRLVKDFIWFLISLLSLTNPNIIRTGLKINMYMYMYYACTCIYMYMYINMVVMLGVHVHVHVHVYPCQV